MNSFHLYNIDHRTFECVIEKKKDKSNKVIFSSWKNEEATVKLEMMITIDSGFKRQLHQLQAQLVQVLLHQQVSIILQFKID